MLLSGVLSTKEPQNGDENEDEEEDENISVSDMIVPDTIVAVAAPEDSMDQLWFVKVLRVDCVELEDVFDTYKNKIPAGLTFLKGQFLEKDNIHKHHTTYKLSQGLTYFYKESVLFPYVQMVVKNNKFVLHNQDWLDIQYHVEQTGFAHL